MNLKQKEMKLIHYGADGYEPALFAPISDEYPRNKPSGGLWTSPVVSEYGWKEWSIENSYGDLERHFHLKFSGTVLEIDSVLDMDGFTWLGERYEGISFEALCCPHFVCDAVHLTEQGESVTRYTHPRSMYGWDCETMLILNPASICAA